MQYLIRVTRHYYAGTILSFQGKTSYIDATGVPTHAKSWQYVKPFGCRAEAMAEIERMEEEPYYTGNGETGRPTLTAVPETRWPDSITGYLSGLV